MRFTLMADRLAEMIWPEYGTSCHSRLPPWPPHRGSGDRHRFGRISLGIFAGGWWIKLIERGGN